MTAPHRYIENQFVHISRRTQNQMPLIIPDAEGALAKEIRFIFAREASLYKIVILALTVTPFGYDAVIFDPKMKRSHFFKAVNQCVSCAVKRRIDHGDSLWSNAKPGNIPILDMPSLQSAILEVCLIPVKLGYVRKVEEWDLPTIGPSDWGNVETLLDPRKPQNTAKFRPIVHNPGMIEVVNYATKVFDLKEGLETQVAAFEQVERRRRKRVLTKAARRKKSSYNLANRPSDGGRGWARCVCAKRLEKVAMVMKFFLLDYMEAMAKFTWPIWPPFPCGTLKMREFHKVTCNSIQDDPFVFDPTG